MLTLLAFAQARGYASKGNEKKRYLIDAIVKSLSICDTK